MENRKIKLHGCSTNFEVDDIGYNITSNNIQDVEDIYFKESKRLLTEIDNNILTFEKELKQSLSFRLLPKANSEDCFEFIKNQTILLNRYSPHFLTLYFCTRGNKSKIEMVYKHFKQLHKLIKEYIIVVDPNSVARLFLNSGSEILRVDEHPSIFNTTVFSIQNSIYDSRVKSYDVNDLKGL